MGSKSKGKCLPKGTKLSLGKEGLKGPGHFLFHTSVYYYLTNTGDFAPINDVLVSSPFTHSLFIFYLLPKNGSSWLTIKDMWEGQNSKMF